MRAAARMLQPQQQQQQWQRQQVFNARAFAPAVPSAEHPGHFGRWTAGAHEAEEAVDFSDPDLLYRCRKNMLTEQRSAADVLALAPDTLPAAYAAAVTAVSVAELSSWRLRAAAANDLVLLGVHSQSARFQADTESAGFGRLALQQYAVAQVAAGGSHTTALVVAREFLARASMQQRASFVELSLIHI